MTARNPVLSVPMNPLWRFFGEFAASRREYRLAFVLVTLLLAAALLYPVFTVFLQSVSDASGPTLGHWTSTFGSTNFWMTAGRSLFVAGAAAFASATLAFIAAYGLTFSNLPGRLKRAMHVVILLPLFCPRSRTASQSSTPSAAWGL